MEDLLNKNIFDDFQLNKLCPDYVPAIPIRMEMRRNSVLSYGERAGPFIVKDTHTSGTIGGRVLKTDTWQRKSLKRPKDTCKFNKEIVKIRNSFHNIDLKNRIMLKYIDSAKPKAVINNEKSLIKGNQRDIEDEKKYLLQEITDELNNLVINSDSDFKINAKPSKVIKYHNTENFKRIQAIERQSPDVVDEVNEEILKVECKYSIFIESPQFDEILNENDDTEELNYQQQPRHNNFNNNAQENKLNVEEDLQSLLIMMALSPKSNRSNDSRVNETPRSNENVQHQIKESAIEKPSVVAFTTAQEDSIIGMGNFLCINPIKIKISQHQEAILKKYVEKWKQFVKSKKKYLNDQRQATLDNFFDKLTKKKMNIDQTQESNKRVKQLAQDYNTYQRRYKWQKHIIALQRAKLEEQNRMIEELKYNKIVAASRNSVDDMREEVRKAYNEIDRQLRPKIKCLTNELKLNDIEETSLVLHCLKVPQFLKRMEKRAREREEKHAIIRERRRQMEEERIRLKQQAVIAKAEMDKEEKMQQLKELRDKRKREKVESIRKKQFAARLRGLIVMADLHYEKTLKTKYGIAPFKILLAIRCDNIEKAKAHYMFQLKNNVFLNWMWYTEDMWFERNFKADEFYRRKALKKGIEGFRQNCYQYVQKKQVADDYYDLYVTQLVFRKFREGIDVLKAEQEMKWKRAVAYHNSNLLYKAVNCWRTLPALNALKREQDARKARWRDKVLQVVPDYTPPED